MNIPVLGHMGRKKSLSGQNAKAKRMRKNILWVQDNLDSKPSSKSFDPEAISKVTAMLQNVLPSAHIYNYQPRSRKMYITGRQPNEEMLQAKLKRKQLLFGANVVSKGLQNDLVACVLFADDITPELFRSQLEILCNVKNIPYLYIPKLREITRKALGFPCIVIGFKKDTSDFGPSVELINTVFKSQQEDKGKNDAMKEEKFKPNDFVQESETIVKNHDKDEDEKPFVYLHRDVRAGKRAFIPEEHDDGGGDETTKIPKITEDFIPLETEIKKEPIPEQEPELEPEAETEADEKIFLQQNRGQKRKIENDVINDEGQDFSFEYNVAKIIKIHGNPGREKKKRRKVKKNR